MLTKINPSLSHLAEPLAALHNDPDNARVHDERNLSAIEASLATFGQQKPIVVNRVGKVIAGNGTLAAATRLGWDKIAVVRFDNDNEAREAAYAIADNRTSELAAWDSVVLAETLRTLDEGMRDVTGFSTEDINALIASTAAPTGTGTPSPEEIGEARASLAERFLVPPFSVLDARQGYWRDRSAKWEALGLNSRSGREAGLISGSNGMTFRDPSFYIKKREKEATLGRELSTEEFKRDHYVVEDGTPNGTSVFDPVMAEVAYSWFSPKEGAVLDPFAGGSTRGVVAGILGRSYTGVDLRPEQVEANRASAAEIFAAAAAAAEPGTGAPRVCIASIRGGQTWSGPLSSIYDASIVCLLDLLEKQGIKPSLFNFSLSADDKPKTDTEALEKAEVVYILSSNEFLFHGKSDDINPRNADHSNERLTEKILPALRGKRVVVISQDRHDSLERFTKLLEPAALASLAFVSECDVPLTVQTLRFTMLAALPPIAKDLDFAYWGTTKRKVDGENSNDARFPILRDVLTDDAIASALVGNTFGKRKADAPFTSDMKAVAAIVGRARATACFQWPGHGEHLTARYHEALALGIVPLVHASYDTGFSVSIPWQRFASVDELKEKVRALRNEDFYKAKLAEVLEAYREERPSDDAQRAAYSALLAPALAREAPAAPAANVEPDSPPWAKGYPLALLEEIAAVFGSHDRGMIFGAFGKVKEAMVAEWLASGKLSTITASTGAIVGAVVLEEASKPAKLSDFTDAEIGEVPKGALRLRRLACPAEYGRALVDLIREKRGARALVAEVWQEHPVDRAVVEALGLTWIGSKVRASSEIVGIWHSEQRAEVVPPREKLALVPLSLRFDVEPLAQAIRKLGPTWIDHYSSYNKHHSWKALALRGYGGRTEFIVKPSEMSKAWKTENAAALALAISDTPLRATLPEVEAILEKIPGRHHRVRLMRLAPDDGELSRHADITDPDSGIANGKLLRLHIPIETNPGVVFEQWLLDGNMVRGHMGRGECWSIDTRKPHRAFNRGATERIHLVVDVESTAELRALLGENLAPVSVVEPATLGDFRASETKGGAPTPTVGSSAKMPEWIVGDSRVALDALPPESFDFAFSCPPYADLERYSDDAADLSTMEYDAFLDAYREIIAKSVARLRPDSFACFVVGEVREKKTGGYRNFVSDTIRAFVDAGCLYYNEAILVTAAGSLPIRVSRFFSAAKKLGKTHQNVLVFVKGDPTRASERVGPVDVADPAASFGEVVE